jgi:hypothetical protein
MGHAGVAGEWIEAGLVGLARLRGGGLVGRINQESQLEWSQA